MIHSFSQYKSKYRLNPEVTAWVFVRVKYYLAEWCVSDIKFLFVCYYDYLHRVWDALTRKTNFIRWKFPIIFKMLEMR